MRKGIEDRIRQLGWSEPPAELRSRILADADAVPVRITWSDRLWFSQTFRWSVAAAVVAMIALWALPGGSYVPGGLEPAEYVNNTHALEDSVIDAGVPAEFAKALVNRTLVARDARSRKAFEADGGGEQ